MECQPRFLNSPGEPKDVGFVGTLSAPKTVRRKENPALQKRTRGSLPSIGSAGKRLGSVGYNPNIPHL